jgi:L-malate glycosyltransferase
MSSRAKCILVVCPYPQDEVPSQRLKYEQYFSHLRAHGFRLVVSPFFERFFYRRLYLRGHYVSKVIGTMFGYAKRFVQIAALPFYDGIFVSLNVTPLGGSLFERLYRAFSRRMIYDIDDLVFMARTSENNRLVASLRGPQKYYYLMQAADHVITCTPYLDSVVRKYNPNTTDISSTINTDTYVPREHYAKDQPLVLGWSGSHSTVGYLRLLAPVLQRLRRRHEFTLLVIGTSDFAIQGIKVQAQCWNRESEVRDLQQIDIGLYPLPDEEWVLGKSGLKALQYMALGIPTVATAVGANFRVVENGVSGFLVWSPDEWESRLSDLIQNAPLRAKIGREARRRVEAIYSVRANEPIYLRIFESVYSSD